ncbi:MAG: phosphoglucomutase/phosphomannomutase family protein [Proteobacteria bacterium]|nr:phosphoglucomutase/phosphomannomutase family protein [Pseudomonadota bacterium]
MNQIKFGTSGWRGIIGEEFTLERVRVVVQAIADYLSKEGLKDKGIIIGHDSRFMGEWFSKEAVKILSANGIKSYLISREAPTPVISYEILRRKTAGAINFTASHNPPEYNGIKFSPQWGGPALPETTKWIETRANELLGQVSFKESFSFEKLVKENVVEIIDPSSYYIDALREKVDFKSIANSQIKIIIDPMYGTARGYIDRVLEEEGLKCKVIHDFRDPYFGGSAPDPMESNLKEIISWLKEDKKLILGVATDGDGDRFGIVDRGGVFIIPNLILAIIYYYLIKYKGMVGGVGRSYATTHLLDRIARKFNQPLYETPVGFKYLGELISNGKIVLGGEESAGLSVQGHVPEKDGILAGLLVVEIVSKRGLSVCDLIKEIFNEVGSLYSDRKNFLVTSEIRERFKDKLKKIPNSFAGLKVIDKKEIDGVKIYLEKDSWLLFRESGTEPVIRIYAEAENKETLNMLMENGKKFIFGEDE